MKIQNDPLLNEVYDSRVGEDAVPSNLLTLKLK